MKNLPPWLCQPTVASTNPSTYQPTPSTYTQSPPSTVIIKTNAHHDDDSPTTSHQSGSQHTPTDGNDLPPRYQLWPTPSISQFKSAHMSSISSAPSTDACQPYRHSLSNIPHPCAMAVPSRTDNGIEPPSQRGSRLPDAPSDHHPTHSESSNLELHISQNPCVSAFPNAIQREKRRRARGRNRYDPLQKPSSMLQSDASLSNS